MEKRRYIHHEEQIVEIEWEDILNENFNEELKIYK